MMAPKFSPIVAMLLLAGAEVAAPSAARSEEAQAARPSSTAAIPMRVECFVGLTTDMPKATRRYSDLHRGWFCMPAERSAYTH